MSDYVKRLVESQLTKKLDAMPAVLIEGAKSSGKTYTARQMAQSEVLFDVDDNARRLANVSPSELLDGPSPRLLDEWQLVPEIWNHVRRECDKRQSPGQFILTGSSQPTDDITRHSGAGRISRLKLRPMTLFEQGVSSGTNSLRSLLRGESTSVIKPEVTFNDVVETICKGGWPLSYRLETTAALEHNQDYLEEVTRGEIATNGSFDPSRMGRLLLSLSRNVSTSVALNTLRDDVDETMDTRTISTYLDILRRIHVLEEQMPYAFHARSRSQLRVKPKLFLCDPSLAVAATKSTPKTLTSDLEFLGLLFESMVIRDLTVYAQANDANLYFYRDGNGLEVDAIVEDSRGNWLAIEVKLGGTELIESATKSLIRYQNLAISRDQTPPSKMIVITATPEYAMDREDGIAVVPITCLGP